MRTVIVALLLALTWAAAPDKASAQALGTAERDSVIPSKCVECHGAEAMGKPG